MWRSMLAVLAALAAGGCATSALPGDPAKMTAEQLRELAKDRSAAISCLSTSSLAVDVVALYVTIDRAVITGGLEIGAGCEVRLIGAP